ncbi:hypothetical protein KZZ20_10445 [Methylacidiphilum fumariolicum]|uniref:hypothetical protein n=1 Tax=Candidatus Methylacidiphilum fumarolicum TaxID=591154 RepID=UPI0002E0BC83|nr:hypothetical protein [Candidatus Methylacidiphilum fumarolicum]MBW6415921.1 hypothetical protein [Candidatus Methylacidiphilum fumarolicum]
MKLEETEGQSSAPSGAYREWSSKFFEESFQNHQQSPRGGAYRGFADQKHNPVSQVEERKSRKERAGEEPDEQIDPGPRVAYNLVQQSVPSEEVWATEHLLLKLIPNAFTVKLEDVANVV